MSEIDPHIATPRERSATGPSSAHGVPGASAPKSGPQTSPASDPRRTAWTLGLLGLVPFVVMAAAFLYAGRAFIAFDMLVLAFTGYSATILAFLGGIRWGLGLTGGGHRRRKLIVSVLPALFGWILLFVPAPWTFAGFAVGFALHGLWDRMASRGRSFPGWFATLRLVLTAVVVLCQIAAFATTF